MVLIAASDYFRTMLKTCYKESRCEKLVLPGVQPEDLEPIINYFYTGSITINGDNVGSLLSASSFLLLPSLIQGDNKIKILSNQIDVEYVTITISIRAQCYIYL